MDLEGYNWHVRRATFGDGRKAGQKRIQRLCGKYGCKCRLWFPSRIRADGATEELFPGYALQGIPADSPSNPCRQRCALPLQRLPVDVDREPLKVETLKWISALEISDSDPNLARGQRVLILDGPFASMEGRFSRMSQATIAPMAFVEITIFRRELEVPIPPLAIAAL